MVVRSRIFTPLAGFVMILAGMAQTSLAGVSWQTVAAFPGDTANFGDDVNWDAPDYDPVPTVGPELTPPGFDSTWFIEGAADDDETPEDDSRPGFDGTIFLSEDRDGSDMDHPKLGAGAIGGGLANEVTRLVISANVTFTGIERDSETGEYSATTRQVRVGQQDQTPGDDNFPWGIVQQTSGHVFIEMANEPDRGDLIISDDKVDSAGGIWEVSGDASLNVTTDILLGTKGGVRSPGSIFRVRGSNAGEIFVGDRFAVRSQSAVWDVGEVDLGAGYRHQFNRGKSVVEFVLDAGGVSPIIVGDNLDLGANAILNTLNLGETVGILPAFLRVKLSEPTAVGQGVFDPEDPGAGDVIVLIEADRITTDTLSSVPAGAEELNDGRFFDPDHTNDAGTSPHRALLNGFRINSDYAGAVYSWIVNYADISNLAADDGEITPAVVLSELQIIGTPGDLDDDTMVTDADRTMLMNAIAAPPVSDYDLINASQHLFDLNGDDSINELDLAVFNTHFLAPTGLPGDYNNDGFVDAADYTVWRNNLGDGDETNINNNGDGGDISITDYQHWKDNYGMGGPGGGGLAGLSGSVVPEPSSVLLALLAVAGVFGMGRRGRVTA